MAVGVLGACLTMGLLACVVAYSSVSVVAVTALWGLTLETGISRLSAVRWGLDAALVALVAVGLCELDPWYGLLVGIAVGGTSPTAQRLVSHVRSRRTKSRADRPAHTPGVLVDKALLDRRFYDIVSPLTESGEFPEG
jgi:hypothetical protein